jgi:DNA-binding NarL/FixJ family response regulator
MHDDEMLVTELFRAGARGYLLKSDAVHYLIAAIKALASHKPFFTPKMPEALSHSLTARSGHEGTALMTPSISSCHSSGVNVVLVAMDIFSSRSPVGVRNLSDWC